MKRQDKIVLAFGIIAFVFCVVIVVWRFTVFSVLLLLAFLFVIVVIGVAIDIFWSWYTKE